MINNIEYIKPLLKFDSTDDFYLLEIIQRKKENPGLSKNARIIKTYNIKSIDHLEKVIGEIILLCNCFNARAGIRLNKRSFRKTALDNLRKLTEIIISENYDSAYNQYYKAAGNSFSNQDKKWIIDIDQEDIDNLDEIKKSIESIRKESILAEIPSKTGLHLITLPFNRELFNFNVEIHKDNPTNLIIP